MNRFDRRTLLRGTLAGGAVSMGLPLLDCFLNGNATGLAQGAPLPLRFGAWMWGCGVNPERWTPATEGAGYELPIELQALDRELANGTKLRDQVSILSGFDVKLDGRPNFPHTAGLMGTLTGSLPLQDYTVPAPTLDTIIAAEIGRLTRFRSLEMSCTGNPNQSYSYESQSVFNAPELSPMALYTRVFGPEFADPNAGPFTPEPRLALRQSVLSAVKDDRERLLQQVGTHDKQRLDQYFTSVRQLEQQLDILLAGPPDLEGCSRAPAPGPESLGTEVGQSMSTNRLMAELLSFALACDQTRVFSMMFSDRISGLRQPGSSSQHHQLTHDEALDPAVGYQPEATEFVYASMEAWADFLERLAAVPEGDGTLLDNCLVFGHSDVSLAKAHAITGIPMMIAGRARGALKSGVHVRGATSSTTRVGLTIQQVMGLNTESWGTRSMEATQGVSEILA
ncbi:MAG: DUF1552 domain-containing protein [Polyangiales bacterium]